MKVVVKDLCRLNELIIRKGLTRRGLAQVANIGTSTVLHICGGSRNPGPAVAKKIVDTLGVDFDEIFEIVSAEEAKEGVYV
ncbi:helix-turn-helix transcriptional regulator [Paenibacillus sp. GXUN7292]|uniref:helix-turn-helix transcriptional regulator n=1 Tax=Paenibacillus sp. GXUN7292 TaxID=3422499 RepID=UPI003D7E1B5A